MIQAENWENSRGTEVDVVKSRWADSAVRGNTVQYITISRSPIIPTVHHQSLHGCLSLYSLCIASCRVSRVATQTLRVF